MSDNSRGSLCLSGVVRPSRWGALPRADASCCFDSRGWLDHHSLSYIYPTIWTSSQHVSLKARGRLVIRDHDSGSLVPGLSWGLVWQQGERLSDHRSAGEGQEAGSGKRTFIFPLCLTGPREICAQDFSAENAKLDTHLNSLLKDHWDFMFK